jgi:hypothetical protein
MTEEDKREFVRMDVQIPFLYRILSGEDAQKINCPSFPDYTYFTDYIAGELVALDQSISKAVDRVSESSPEIAEVLRLLEQKVEINRERIDAVYQNVEVPLRWVNLSATGVGITANIDAKQTDKVDILYRLDNTMPIVLLRCEVIQVTHIGGTRNKLSLKFEKISEKNKRDIVMFLQEKQIEKARRKKGE